ncbi:bifunctional tetrahydrofolate synthase/dihydrofolate synthase [Psychromonas ossibalaenae]|uniref:bifunctional tetrahydrofolate synthase/dihydrofolate synthase n=1 Tax=Psychromonas ossibalaenae TaxID=444922 RepID=UPI00039EF03F|nr:bifunctional tetrahydrofolate synthase/dihydrofolate synthase [Psychromonas ossibalaenae]
MHINKEKSLNEWLSHIEKLHPSEIELGLRRISKVAQDLNLIHFDAKVITVAGTNGKGTTCAFLEEILIQAGYKVGVYSSPHIQRYTERLRINRQEQPEKDHCLAFEQIEKTRKETSLSYFEYVTLGCLYLLRQAQCDFILLEVGLGGRLDATNMVESDISVITTIGIDHVDWLGDDREKIGYEKAGVFRAGKPAVCGEFDPPQSLKDYAAELSTNIRYAGSDFSFEMFQDQWLWTGDKKISGLSPTLMPMQNASTALAVIEALNLNVDPQTIKNALREAKLAGRLQNVDMSCEADVYLDVAHNPQSAQYLAGQLKLLKEQKGPQCRVFAIAGMLEDKDITGTFDQVNQQLDHCCLISLNCFRGADNKVLLKHYQASCNKLDRVNCFEDIESAYKSIINNVNSSDIIIVFGSFYTVSDFLTLSQG